MRYPYGVRCYLDFGYAFYFIYRHAADCNESVVIGDVAVIEDVLIVSWNG